MSDPRRVGRLVGALLLLHLVTGLTLPYMILHPLTTAPAGFLESAARMEPVVRMLVFTLLVGGVLPVAIAILLWPVVRERRPRTGLVLLVLAVTNLVLQLVENSHWLTMLSVSQEYARAGAGAAERFGLIALAVRAAWKWAHYSHIFVVVAWLFTLFLTVMQARLAPRLLGGLGVLLCTSQFFGITLPAFAGYRMPFGVFFGAPLALAIIALALWALARGFDGRSAGAGLATGPARAGT